jgi:imidazolonepropionase-like amidohydrolase
MTSESNHVLVIENGTLIDGTGAPPRPNERILIRGTKIAAVGSDAAAETDGKTQTIDATGRYIMPGLIDGHVHISMFQGTPRGIRYPSSAEYCTLHAARSLLPTLRAGVTSISVPGGRWFVDATLRDAVATGLLRGPRIFCAGQALTPYGGIFDNRPSWEGGLPPDAVGVLCNTVDDYVVEVRRQAKHGVDMIKIADSYWGDHQTVTRAEIAAVVEEAHRRGVRVVIHARGGGSTRDAALAGVDWIFHADHATGADLDAVAKAGIPIMPVFAQGQITIDHGAEHGFSAETRERLKRQLDINIRAIAIAREHGIKILAGTDSGNGSVTTPGRYHGYEAAFLVERLGFTPLEAIAAHTRDNGLVMGLDGELGTIEPGKIADLLILDEDPVRNIAVLGDPAHVRAIVKDGRPIDLAQLDAALTAPLPLAGLAA